MKRALVLAVLLLVLASLLPPLRASALPVTAVISGPSAVAPSSTNTYVIRVTGGPAADAPTGGTYTIEFEVQGDSPAGADPIVPRTQANANGNFTVNVTAPAAEGVAQLHVKATSTDGATSETTETRLTLYVAQPVELRAFLRNLGAATATNVTVFFYVDGALVGNTTVGSIPAGGQVEVNITYIPVDLAIGQHTVKITADLDHDGAIEPDRGELLESDFFYKTERSNLSAVLTASTALVLIILVFLLFAIRRQRRQG